MQTKTWMLIAVLGAGCGGETASTTDGGTADAAPADGGTILHEDASTTPRDKDADVTPPTDGCESTGTSTLPNVRFVIHSERCTFTLAESQTKQLATIELIVDADVTVTQLAPDGPEPQTLIQSVSLGDGGSHKYCYCDVGKTPSPVDRSFVLKKGTYKKPFEWLARDWSGPSDYGAPYGPPFPAGTYAIRVQSIGKHDAADFKVEAALPITITP